MIKSLMVQGTASHVGKTILVSGICRSLSKKGIKVCPFKPQNITSNIVNVGRGEVMGYAQYLQAKSCRITPDVRMNPVVINISGNSVNFVINGKVVRYRNFAAYGIVLQMIKDAIVESYISLSKDYDLIIIEGSGSPAEINRIGDDVSNMWFANHFQVPVILVGNMEYGGGFASIVGTFELLEPSFLSLVKGFVLNKYEGHTIFLDKGIKYIENKYNKRFLGVLPYVKNLNIPEEDTLHSMGNSSTINSQKINLSDSFDVLAYNISRNIDLDFILSMNFG